MSRHIPVSNDYDEPLLGIEVEHAKAFAFILLRYRWLIARQILRLHRAIKQGAR